METLKNSLAKQSKFNLPFLFYYVGILYHASNFKEDMLMDYLAVQLQYCLSK